MSKKRKSGHENVPDKVLLVTAIIKLLSNLVELIKDLID